MIHVLIYEEEDAYGIYVSSEWDVDGADKEHEHEILEQFMAQQYGLDEEVCFARR